jgi:hypothetical protein
MTYKKEKDAIIVYQKENSKKVPKLFFSQTGGTKKH